MQHVLSRIPRAVARLAVVAFTTVVAVVVLPAIAAAATEIGFADDTPGVYIYTGWLDSSYDPTTGISAPATGPNPDGSDCDALNHGVTAELLYNLAPSGRITYVGDEPSEIISITPGDDGETAANSTVDTTVNEVIEGLTQIDDYGSVQTFASSDDSRNVDLGTGGVLHLATGSSVIVADGLVSTGAMNDYPAGENLDGADILILEDNELSGMSIELRGDGQTFTIDIADYQVNPSVASNSTSLYGNDDIMIAIDLDTVPFTGRWVDEIIITDDGAPTSPPGRSDCDPTQTPNRMDTSVGIDAVVVQYTPPVTPTPVATVGRSDVGFADDTSGVYIYTALVDPSYDRSTGISTPATGPTPGGAECSDFIVGEVGVVLEERVITAGGLELIGDEGSEVASLVPGDGGETDRNSTVDTTIAEVNLGLRAVDDFGLLGSFGTGDDNSNADLGTGGVLGLTTGSSVIVADGVASTGRIVYGGDQNLDGAEILIFDDAELSGMSIELRGDGQAFTVDIADYQVNPDVSGGADDIMIAIDLDTLPFAGRWVDEIIITDDGIPTSPPGRSDCDPEQRANIIDTSAEIDAVAVRATQLIERNYATTVLLVGDSIFTGSVPDLTLSETTSPAVDGASDVIGIGVILVTLAGAATFVARRRTSAKSS